MCCKSLGTIPYFIFEYQLTEFVLIEVIFTTQFCGTPYMRIRNSCIYKCIYTCVIHKPRTNNIIYNIKLFDNSHRMNSMTSKNRLDLKNPYNTKIYACHIV